MSEQIIKPAAIGLRFGAVAGLACVLLTLTLYLISPEMVFSWWFFSGFAIIVFLKIWSVYSIMKAKRVVDFKEGLQSAFMVSVVSLLLWTTFNSLLVGVFDPSLIEAQKKISIERTASMMEKFNAPEEKIDETLDAMEEEDYKPTFGKVALNYAFSLFVGFVYAVLTAGIFHYASKGNKLQPDFSPN
ncbi:MAG: DUF4199 domain-containing protein [Chitinophagales bacterium]|nr:DUF4199 domain-containing protein [Chitinophagales bacterium]